MLIGNPFVANVNRIMNEQELIQALRLDMADELEAIISYEAHAAATNDERVRKVLLHISKEEKNHVGQLQQLIYMLSPADGQDVQEGAQTVIQQEQSNFQAPIQ